jgi:OmpA-OmpF porin, OOP family
VHSNLRGAVAVVAVLSSACALSADNEVPTRPAFRFGLGGGRASIETDDASLDDSTVALELFIGWEFNRYLAIEGGYMYGGKVEEESAVVLDDTGGFYVSAIGSFPIDDVMSAYARAGWLDWSHDRELHTGSDTLVAKNAGDSGLLFGAGFAALIEGTLVRVEYRIADLEDTDLGLLSLAVAWRF